MLFEVKLSFLSLSQYSIILCVKNSPFPDAVHRTSESYGAIMSLSPLKYAVNKVVSKTNSPSWCSAASNWISSAGERERDEAILRWNYSLALHAAGGWSVESNFTRWTELLPPCHSSLDEECPGVIIFMLANSSYAVEFVATKYYSYFQWKSTFFPSSLKPISMFGASLMLISTLSSSLSSLLFSPWLFIKWLFIFSM